MKVDFSIARGTTNTPINCLLADKLGVKNLVGATVRFRMIDYAQGEAKIDAPATVLFAEAERVPADYPNVKYDFRAEDVDTPGHYEAQWIVTYSGGRQQTFPDAPEKPFLLVQIV
jgi:hypothetical protein